MLLLVALAHADDTFFPGEGDTRVSYAEALAAGRIRGRTGRVLVGADDPRALRGRPDVAAVRALPGGVFVVTPATGVDDLAFARSLHGTRGVAFAVPDVLLPLTTASTPDDPYYANEWHLDNTGQSGVAGTDINAPLAWEHATGAGQLVAVIDSGVQLDHPDLSVIGGHDYIDGDDDPSPDTTLSDYTHGTDAAGVAAAVGNNGYGVAGVAYDADVYAIRLIGGATSMADLYDAFTEAVDAGAVVLSNSWGFSDDCAGIDDYVTFRRMFEYAEEDGRGGLGSVVVFAAGNNACDIGGDAMLAYDQPIVVAAVEQSDTRAWYSSYGAPVDLAAPTNLLTTDYVGGGYGSYDGDDAFVDGFSGTSAATPVVAGTVALLFEANPRLTASEVRSVLCATATRVDVSNGAYDETGWSPYYGCGRVDAGAAVAAVVDGGAPGAPTPALVRADVPVGRVELAWSPPGDDDVVGYELAWWRDGEDEAAAPTIAVDATTYDLGAELVEGDVVDWKVRALDRWGAGDWSPTTQLTVVSAEGDTAVTWRAQDAACATTGAAAAPWMLVGAGVAAWRRRRGSRPRPPGDPALGLDVPALCASLAADVGVPVLPTSDHPRVTVSGADGHATLVVVGDDGTARTRSVDLPAEPDRATQTVALLAGGLLRDQVGEPPAPPASPATPPAQDERPFSVRHPFGLGLAVSGASLEDSGPVVSGGLVLSGDVGRHLSLGVERLGGGFSSTGEWIFLGAPFVEVGTPLGRYQPFGRLGVDVQASVAGDESRADFAARAGAGLRYWVLPYLTVEGMVGADLALTDSFLLGGARVPRHTAPATLTFGVAARF